MKVQQTSGNLSNLQANFFSKLQGSSLNFRKVQTSEMFSSSTEFREYHQLQEKIKFQKLSEKKISKLRQAESTSESLAEFKGLQKPSEKYRKL